MTMKLLTAMAADGAAIASPAPPRPPNVPAGPRRDRGTAESSPHRHRGTAGAPIDAAVAHGSPTFGHAARRRRPRIQARGARARRETSREGSRPFARHRGDQARSTPGTTSRRALRAVIMMNDDTGF